MASAPISIRKLTTDSLVTANVCQLAGMIKWDFHLIGKTVFIGEAWNSFLEEMQKVNAEITQVTYGKW